MEGHVEDLLPKKRLADSEPASPLATRKRDRRWFALRKDRCTDKDQATATIKQQLLFTWISARPDMEARQKLNSFQKEHLNATCLDAVEDRNLEKFREYSRMRGQVLGIAILQFEHASFSELHPRTLEEQIMNPMVGGPQTIFHNESQGHMCHQRMGFTKCNVGTCC